MGIVQCSPVTCYIQNRCTVSRGVPGHDLSVGPRPAQPPDGHGS